MKTLVKIFITIALGVSLLQAAAFEKIAESDMIKVVLSADKPLTTGSNLVSVALKDEKYKDAKVSIKIFMPEMPGMPVMSQTSDAKAMGNGNYEVNLNFSMSGTWQVWIFVAPKEGKKIRVKTSLNL